MNPQAQRSDLRSRMTVMSSPGPLSGQARHGLAVRLAVGASSAVQAQRRVDSAWVRATLPNQSATGSFVCLTAQKDVVLTGVSFPVAGIVEVHEMSRDQASCGCVRPGPCPWMSARPSN